MKCLYNSPERKREQALAIYLFWLKTGISQYVIASHFGLKERIKISHYCTQVRQAFTKTFVPLFLGPEHLKRHEWLQKNTKMLKTLYTMNDEQFGFIADGTYLYCEKSGNNYIQRICYSVQKGRALIKPFVLCCADGYIIDIYGPFPATLNDAKIMEHNMNNDKSLINILRPNDLAILDRGFRDVVDLLNRKYQLLTKMPTCIYEVFLIIPIVILSFMFRSRPER